MEKQNRSAPPERENALPDIPVGLGMRLAMDEPAMSAFGRLDPVQKRRVIDFVESAVSGPDALDRIESAVRALGDYNAGLDASETKHQS